MLKPVKRERHRSRGRSKRFRCGEMLPNFRVNLCSAKRWDIEFQILSQHWKLVVFSVLMQFIHSSLTNIAYYNHVQGDRLPDIGFKLLPELSDSMNTASEYFCFVTLFTVIAVGLGMPFCHKRPRYYSVCPSFQQLPVTHYQTRSFLAKTNYFCFVQPFSFRLYLHQQSTLFIRCTFVMACLLVIRCICFLTTSLPGPAEHCQPGSFEYDPPRSWYEVAFRVDFVGGCGDLIFSSHIAISLCLAISVHVYGTYLVPRWFYMPFVTLVWANYILMTVCIIAARKHYTVDVFIAWYTAPLMYHASYRFFPDQEGEPSSRTQRTYRQKSGGVRLQRIEKDIIELFPLPKDNYSD